jgi:rhodanese-related sulfurtransferase
MSNSVYKYYLNGHQYTPKNTGDITINYERVQENGSYQYVKNIGNSVVYDNKNGAYDYINSFGECQKINLTIIEFCIDGEFTIFDGLFTKRDCSFQPDLKLIDTKPQEDSLYKCLTDSYDRDYNFLEAPTIVSSTYLTDVSQYDYQVDTNTFNFLSPLPFFGEPLYVSPPPISPVFGFRLFARETKTTYCQGGQPQAPAQGTGEAWQILFDNCAPKGLTTWFRKASTMLPPTAVGFIDFDITGCTGAGCTPLPPALITGFEIWVLMEEFELTAPAGSLSIWIDEHSIPVTPVELNNGRPLTEVINLGLNKFCSDLDLQSNFLFDDINPVTGNSPSSTEGIQVHAITDVKYPDATEEASREDINLSDIFSGYLEGRLNCFWAIDEGTQRLIVEHYNDLNNQQVIDLTAIEGGKYIQLRNNFEYDNSDIPKAENFPSLDFGIDYTGVDISYDFSGTNGTIINSCATGKKSYITDKYYSEVSSIIVNPTDYPIDGVVMITPDSLAPPNSTDAAGIPIGNRSEDGAITGDYDANMPQGMANLHSKFWAYRRPFNSGSMNFIPQVFSKVKPVKKLQSIAIPLECFFLFFPRSSFIGNNFTNGQLIGASFSPASGFITLQIEY